MRRHNGLQQLLAQIQGGHGNVPMGAMAQQAPGGFVGGPMPAQAGPTGGMLAPHQPDAADAAGSQAGDPLANLVAGFQKWSQSHGQGAEPLARAAQQITDPSQQGLAQVGRVNQSGNARSGLGFQTYDLGHGRMAHVYYDPKTGKRQVIKFNKAAAA